jgi:Tol biopolymer transport system component
LKRCLTRDAGNDVTPVWSPDGRRIAWVHHEGLRWAGIHVMSADGSGRRRLPSAFPSALVDWLPQS